MDNTGHFTFIIKSDQVKNNNSLHLTDNLTINDLNRFKNTVRSLNIVFLSYYCFASHQI